MGLNGASNWTAPTPTPLLPELDRYLEKSFSLLPAFNSVDRISDIFEPAMILHFQVPTRRPKYWSSLGSMAFLLGHRHCILSLVPILTSQSCIIQILCCHSMTMHSSHRHNQRTEPSDQGRATKMRLAGRAMPTNIRLLMSLCPSLSSMSSTSKFSIFEGLRRQLWQVSTVSNTLSYCTPDSRFLGLAWHFPTSPTA